MKLFIDDIRTPPDDSWHICRSVLSAIRALDMFSSDITDIMLDHDISHQVVVGKMSRPYPCEETFEAVARYMARLRITDNLFDPRITIHTSNPVGARNIKMALFGANFSSVQIDPNVKGANRLETIL